jgi:hypothetical protein
MFSNCRSIAQMHFFERGFAVGAEAQAGMEMISTPNAPDKPPVLKAGSQAADQCSRRKHARQEEKRFS